MQAHLTHISDWTSENMMQLNETNIFTRSKHEFSTRLEFNSIPLKIHTVTKILGIWLQEDMGMGYQYKANEYKSILKTTSYKQTKICGYPYRRASHNL